MHSSVDFQVPSAVTESMGRQQPSKPNSRLQSAWIAFRPAGLLQIHPARQPSTPAMNMMTFGHRRHSSTYEYDSQGDEAEAPLQTSPTLRCLCRVPPGVGRAEIASLRAFQ
jgi:hypothetical protein